MIRQRGGFHSAWGGQMSKRHPRKSRAWLSMWIRRWRRFIAAETCRGNGWCGYKANIIHKNWGWDVKSIFWLYRILVDMHGSYRKELEAEMLLLFLCTLWMWRWLRRSCGSSWEDSVYFINPFIRTHARIQNQTESSQLLCSSFSAIFTFIKLV